MGAVAAAANILASFCSAARESDGEIDCEIDRETDRASGIHADLYIRLSLNRFIHIYNQYTFPMALARNRLSSQH